MISLKKQLEYITLPLLKKIIHFYYNFILKKEI